jgi:hypothetical protein
MSNLVLGLVATSVGVSQAAGDKALITRVYEGNDFEGYFLDPPYWSYHSEEGAKSAHWLYKNHRHVFIDIKVICANSSP